MRDPELQQHRIVAEDEVHELLQDQPETDRTILLAQVTEGYEEQDRRAERFERRATTLLASVSLVTAVLGAGGTALAGSELLKHGGFRIAFAVAIALVIALFGLAALWALQVLFIPDTWKRPATPTMLAERAARRGADLYEHSVAALLDSARFNQKLADIKSRSVRKASGFFTAGVIGLVLVAIALPLVSGFFPPPDKKPDQGATGPGGPAGPAGPSGKTIVHAAQVRGVFASRFMHARVGRPLRVRYAATAVGEAALEVVHDGTARRPIVEPTAFGARPT